MTLHASHQPHIQGAAAGKGRPTKANRQGRSGWRRHQKEPERRWAGGSVCRREAAPHGPSQAACQEASKDGVWSRGSHFEMSISFGASLSAPLWFQGANPLPTTPRACSFSLTGGLSAQVPTDPYGIPSAPACTLNFPKHEPRPRGSPESWGSEWTCMHGDSLSPEDDAGSQVLSRCHSSWGKVGRGRGQGIQRQRPAGVKLERPCWVPRPP